MPKTYRWTRTFTVCSILFATLCLSAPICAQPLKESKVDLAVGVGVAPDYEGSEDYQAIPLLFLKWSQGQRYVSLRGFALYANPIDSPTWEIGPVLRYRPGRDDVDNRAVDRMEDIDDSVELGGFVAVKDGPWRIALEVVKDVADGHDGGLIGLSGGYSHRFGERSRLGVGASTTWASDNYMSANFGVSYLDSLRSGLRPYRADEGIKDVGVNANLTIPAWAEWDFGTTASYKRLLDDAADSPVVDKAGSENQFFLGVTLGRRF